jgi:hypothetical protein
METSRSASWLHRKSGRPTFLYCQVLNGYMPDADEDNWISLGFCTAPDQEDASRLGHLYKSLIERCKFDEF